MILQSKGRVRGGVVLAVLLVALAAGSAGSMAQQIEPPGLGRTVYGVVLDARNQPISLAVVYLQDTASKAIRSVITDDHGSYSFHQLSRNSTYELYAVWKGKKSPVRVDSKYDSQPKVRLDLQIPVV